MAGKKHLVTRRKPNFSDFSDREPRKDGDEFVARREELRKLGAERHARYQQKLEREKRDFIATLMR